MRIFKLLPAVMLTAGIALAPVLAAPEKCNPEVPQIKQEERQKEGVEERNNKGLRHKLKKHRHENSDPLKHLQQRRKKIQSLLREGKITKEEAEEKIRRIDEKIKAIKEFNKLPLNEKRSKLIEKYRLYLEKKVEMGRITPEEAQKLLEQFSKDVENWDGRGFPWSLLKEHRISGKN